MLAKSNQGGRQQRARDDAAASYVLAVAESYRRARIRAGHALRAAVVG